MTAVPLLAGVAGSETGEFVQTYPLNLEPVIIDSKISKGQLVAYPGAVQLGVGPGGDRGGIWWNALLYRIMGTKLVSVAQDGTVTVLGDVGAGARCALDYSFDRLIIQSGTNLYYYTVATGVAQVTDPDLGPVIDAMWIDGYTMTTDGTSIVVTELSDPTSVLPLKYGSAEEDPDPVTGLLKYREEAYVFGRHSIQLFRNVGGNGFPFATVSGGTIPYGCISPQAKCLFGDAFAFVGSARNEALDVFIGGQAQAKAIGAPELTKALAAISETSVIELEARVSDAEQRLLVHLPGETWVFLLKASEIAGAPIWYRLRTDPNGYRCRNAVRAYGKTIVGDVVSGAVGYLSDDYRFHFAVDPGWQFDCGFLYNEALGAIVHSVELVGLPGRGGEGAVFMSMTRDGETFSIERSVRLRPNARGRRIAWRPHARMGNYLGFRFRGTGAALPGIAACEVKPQPLSS